MEIKNLKSRVEKLHVSEILSILNFNQNEKPSESGRKFLNEMVCEKFENEEMDEIELILIESGE